MSLVSLVLMSGCAAGVKRVALIGRHPYPASGYVNIAKVADSDPRMEILKSIDTGIVRAQPYQARRGATQDSLHVQQFLGHVSTLGTVDLRTGLQAEQEDRLNSVGMNVIDSLNDQLVTVQNLQLDALRVESLAEENANLAVSASTLDANASTAAQLYHADSAMIANLKMQIAAMKVNEVPPRTAPKGYWTKLQMEKEAKLNSLISEFTDELRAIYQQRDQSMADDRYAANQSVETKMDLARKDSDTARLASLAQARMRVERERENLIAEDSAVFEEAQKLISSQSAFTFLPGSAEGGRRDALVETGGKFAMTMYRNTLEQSIWWDANRSVNDIAAKLHIALVSKSDGAKDITPLFLKVLKEERWKVS